MAEILDSSKNLDQSDIFDETNAFLSTLISDDKIVLVLDEANNLAQALIDAPNDVSLIEELDKRLIFISNVCGAENKYQAVIDNGGLILLPTCLQALSEAKDCLVREHAIKSAAYAACKLCEYGSPNEMVEDGCYEQMAETLLSNPHYEGLADNLCKLTSVAVRKPDLIPLLHNGKAVEAAICMIRNFPLREDLCALAANNLSKLAVDGETCLDIIQAGGAQAMIKALENMMSNADKDVIETLAAIQQLSLYATDTKFVDANGISAFVEALKEREEPLIVEQALKTVNVLCMVANKCKSDDFFERFIGANGLLEVIKNLDHFSRLRNNADGINITTACMPIISQCCVKGNAIMLEECNAIDKILSAMEMSNDSIIIQNGLQSFANLASEHFGDYFIESLLSEKSLQVITNSVSAHPRDIQIAIGIARLVGNIVSNTGTNTKITQSQAIEIFAQYGFLDSLKVYQETYADNEEVLALIEFALEVIHPKPDTILQRILDNINDSETVKNSLRDLMTILLASEESAVMDAELLCHVLCDVWNKYKLSNADIEAIIMDLVSEMSCSPDYYLSLLESGLVELLMKAAMVDDEKIEAVNDFNFEAFELDALNVLNNLAMINDGKQYLDSIDAEKVIIRSIVRSKCNGNDEHKDIDEQTLLKALRTLALLDNDYQSIISSGMIAALMAIVTDDSFTNKAALAKELISMINDTFVSEQLISMEKESVTDMIDIQSVAVFLQNQKSQFGNNPNLMSICSQVLNTLNSNYIPQPVLPSVPDIKVEVKVDDARVGQAVVNVNMEMKSANVVAPVPPPMIDAEMTFKQAFDRRLGKEQQEEALMAFLNVEVTEAEINQLVNNHAIDKLVLSLKTITSQGVVQLPPQKADVLSKLLISLDKVTKAGDNDYKIFVHSGGVKILLHCLESNAKAENREIVQQSLRFIGHLTVNAQVKTLLGMHNVIELLLQILRSNMKDAAIADKILYCLANLAYNHGINMTQIIELGGIDDILKVCSLHLKKGKLMQTMLDLMSNLMHNSDKNRTLICFKGGGKATLDCLVVHCSSNPKVISSAFRVLGNMAYVPENVVPLVKLGIVPAIVNAMTANLQLKSGFLQLGAAVLSNLATNDRVSKKMMSQGVLTVVLHVSQAFPDEIELQKSLIFCFILFLTIFYLLFVFSLLFKKNSWMYGKLSKQSRKLFCNG